MSDQQIIGDYELKEWIVRLGSDPVGLICEKDFAGAYEKREAHVYELKNGRYALVTEEGCSCYDSNQAEIDLFPSLKSAMDAFNKWCKEKRRESYF